MFARAFLKGFLSLGIALLSGLSLLGLLIILRRLASSVASFVNYLWAAPGQPYVRLEPKDRITLENDLRANRIQVITTVVQALGGIAFLIGVYFATYVRVHAPASKADDKQPTSGGAKSNEPNLPICVPRTDPCPDIQAILTVIGRRKLEYEKGKNEQLNLMGTNLKHADLAGADLTFADLTHANLGGVHGLSQQQVNSAYVSKDTRLPTGLLVNPGVQKNAAVPTSSPTPSP